MIASIGGEEVMRGARFGGAVTVTSVVSGSLPRRPSSTSSCAIYAPATSGTNESTGCAGSLNCT